MNPQMPASPTPAPLHDIAAPVGFFPYPIWMVVVAGLVILGLIALVVWFIAKHRKPKRVLTPAERALQELTRLRAGVTGADPYPFSIDVSDVLRIYLRDARGLSATTQTSHEFLESVRTRSVFNDAEREALAGFLEKADLIKFARMGATSDDCVALLDQAERLLRSAMPSEEASK